MTQALINIALLAYDSANAIDGCGTPVNYRNRFSVYTEELADES